MEFKVGASNSFIKKAVGTDTLQHKNQVSLEDLKALGKPVVALVDADIVAYRSSAATDGRCYTVAGSQIFEYKKDAIEYCEKNRLDPKKDIKLTYHPEPAEAAYKNVENTLTSIRKALEAQKLELYLTPEILFRTEYMSDYKANRKGKRKPANLQACKDYMINNHYAESLDGYEADDLLAIRAKQLIAEGEVTPVICSLDKDLDTISCFHYLWTKGCIYFMSQEESTLFLYKQLLVGDVTDNIPGIHGVGPKKADKILEGLDGSSSYECYMRVLKAYLELSPKEETKTSEGVKIEESKEDFTKRIIQLVTRNARMLYILHKLGEVWYPPVKVGGNKSNGS